MSEIDSSALYSVIPAKAGTHLHLRARIRMGSRLRGNDGTGRGINSIAFAFICTLLCSCAPGSNDSIEVRNARSPAMPPGSSVVAVYADIVANQADTLLGASTTIAAAADMHETSEHGGVMQMQPLAEVRIADGQEARFEPGGKHIMLSGIRQVLPVGTRFPLTLRFAVAGDVTVMVDVVAPGANP